MAGIGFELKKLFSQEGILLRIRAGVYASLVIAGPMLMGAALLLGAKFISRWGRASAHEQDLIIVIITYSLLFSLILASVVLFVLARYIADMLYVNKNDKILPSMYGAISILLTVGGPLWGIFLFSSQLDFSYSLYAFILFCEGIVVWTQINYITAIKEYRSIFLGFLVGIIGGLASGFILTSIGYDVVASLLLGACLTYAILLVDFTFLLHRFFPSGSGSPYKFLEWIDDYPALPFIGLFITIGLFIHIILMWSSPWGVQVEGWFYHAPTHDIPALLAFLTSLISSINFVTAVEVNFYPKYRIYFSQINGDGSLRNIEKAYQEMISVLKQELFYLAIQQVFVTILAIVIFGEALIYLNTSFSLIMVGTFRILCIGYGFYAIGNTLMLLLLYFSNNRDALWAAFTLMVVNTIGTLLVLLLPEIYYGFGFVFAGMAFYLVSLSLLTNYVQRLDYHVFSKQPVFFVEKQGLFRPIVRRLESLGN